jgi:outer membrane protein OmpA-like peptidoglycan-associated protein
MNTTKLLRVSALFLLTFLCFILQLKAQNGYGVFIDYGLNNHKADFRALPGIPSCCPLYQSGSGWAIGGGAFWHMPINTEFSIALRAAYSGLNGQLLREEQTIVSGGQSGVFRHTVDASIQTIGLEPLVYYNVWGPLALAGGIRAAWMMNTQYSQKEQILSPSTGVFSNGRRSRNEVENQELPSATSFYAGLLAGIKADFPMNKEKTLLLCPHILYGQPLTNIISDLGWSISQLRMGIALQWQPALQQADSIIISEPEYSTDTIYQNIISGIEGYTMGQQTEQIRIAEKDGSRISIRSIQRTDTIRRLTIIPVQIGLSVRSVDSTGIVQDLRTLRIEEFTSILMTPLLNYIFFDENSAELPDRYKRSTQAQIESLSEEQLNSSDRLKTYYQVLNIIASRLHKNPTATIKITGCNADIGVEKGNIALSKARATTIKKYLTTVCGINPGRIKTEQRNLPEKAANSNNPDGAQENRRVEINSDNPGIMMPLITSNNVYVPNIPTVRISPQIMHAGALKKWDIAVLQKGKILRTYQGSDNPPDKIDWNIKEEGILPDESGPITIQFRVIDMNDKESITQQNIIVEQLSVQRKKQEGLADKEMNRFRLILFDVRSDIITAANQQIINQIKPFIKKNSQIEITGYTDRSGDPTQNQKLAQDRAESTARQLGATKATVKGLGNSAVFAPELPEGRVFSRTVDILIISPIE